MKITFIEKVGDTSSRFQHIHHKLAQAGHTLDVLSPTDPLPTQTDVLIIADQDFSRPKPELADTYPILSACRAVKAQLRLVLTDNVADGVLGPEWVHLKTPLNFEELVAVINARVNTAFTEAAAK